MTIFIEKANDGHYLTTNTSEHQTNVVHDNLSSVIGWVRAQFTELEQCFPYQNLYRGLIDQTLFSNRHLSGTEVAAKKESPEFCITDASTWPKSFFVHIHRVLWGWLAENPRKGKDDWPGWAHNGGIVPYVCNECPACEWVTQTHGLSAGDRNSNCQFKCLFMWPDEDAGCCFQHSAIFKRWELSGDTIERSRLAAQIRDLPVREE